MTSLALACIWALAANIIDMLPSKTRHRPQAKILIATGLPILALVFWQNGPVWGMLVLIAGASVLRWPVRFLVRWVLGRLSVQDKG